MIIMTAVNFYDLSPDANFNHSPNHSDIQALWQAFFCDGDIRKDIDDLTRHMSEQDWQDFKNAWRGIDPDDDAALTGWLIDLFNQLFNQSNIGIMPTVLVRGDGEPEYFPATDESPARIEFAHGFFASALHEISHWCIAGRHRRTLNDFGYWYTSDGRDAETQAIFEQVEIKPQSIECLLNQACGRYFYVSQDNLNADFDTSQSTFATDVYRQANSYLIKPQTLPRDAKRLLWVFLKICQNFS